MLVIFDACVCLYLKGANQVEGCYLHETELLSITAWKVARLEDRSAALIDLVMVMPLRTLGDCSGGPGMVALNL